jgi:iron complex outermembrane recepter protein
VNLPDLLYRVPGYARSGKSTGINMVWVFVREASYDVNNILVLIDGAVVFNPVFGGTVWESLPVSLNEIERIEIIRGSPGVLYSSNAVNGVINIITKTADSADNYVDQEGGTQSDRDSSIGVGGKIGSTGLALRAYLDNHFDQGFTKNTTGSFSDRYLSDRDGGRIDYTPSDHQRLSVIANNNQENSNSPGAITSVETKTPGETTSAIINYTDTVTDRYDYSIHFDHVEQLATGFSSFDAITHTTSATTQHNFHYDLLGSHVTSVGGELRYNDLNVENMNPTVPLEGLVTNGKASQKIISFYAQDEYRPIDKLILTAGVREDSNSLVINEAPLYSPKVSALYHLTDNHSIWVSSSQTYRTPAFSDHDLSIMLAAPNSYYPGFPGAFYKGSTNLKPEEVLTQEAGYRGLFLDQKLKADATLFLTDTKDVIDLDSLTGTTTNNGSLTTKGAELALDYQFTDSLSFSTDYSYLYPHAKPERTNDPTTLGYDTTMSNNIVGIGTRYTKNNFKLDLYAKYYEGYISQETAIPNVKIRGYYESTFRISYDFKTPGFTGKHDATVYVEVNDPIGARQVETNTISNEVFIKPEVTAGIKVTF